MAILGLLAGRRSSISAAIRRAQVRRRPPSPGQYHRRRMAEALATCSKGGLGGMLAAAAAGSVISGGLGDLLKQLQQAATARPPIHGSATAQTSRLHRAIS